MPCPSARLVFWSYYGDLCIQQIHFSGQLQTYSKVYGTAHSPVIEDGHSTHGLVTQLAPLKNVQVGTFPTRCLLACQSCKKTFKRLIIVPFETRATIPRDN